MSYAELRAMSVEVGQKLAPEFLEFLASVLGLNLPPVPARVRRQMMLRLSRALLGMRGYLLGLELLAGRLPPARANYAMLEGVTREYLKMAGKKLRDGDNACGVLLEHFEKQASAPPSLVRMPRHAETRAAVNALVADLAPHVHEEAFVTIVKEWAESDDARKLIHFGQRLPSLGRGWRRVAPKRLTQQLVAQLTNQYRDCAGVFEQCLRRFVALDRVARGVSVQWAKFEGVMLSELATLASAPGASAHLQTLIHGINRDVRNVLAHGHATVNMRDGLVEFRSKGRVLVAWTPAEFYDAAWTLTVHVLAMLKFDEQLQLIDYRANMDRLAVEASTEEASSAWWTPQRAQIHQWLTQYSGDLADLFAGAVRLLDGQADVSSRLRFIAHAVREIRNRLPDAVAPAVRQRFGYAEAVEELKRALPDYSYGLGHDEPLPASVQVPLQRLLEAHDGVFEKNVDAAHRLFRTATRSGRGDYLRPLAREWHELGEWFMHDVHVGNKRTEARDEAQYRARFGRFEAILATLAADFFTPLEKLDAVLRDPAAALEDALVHVGHDEQVRYFFERLDRPDWVGELKKKRFFQDPPPPVVEEGGRSFRFPPWPALRFLVRVAERAPDAVLGVATSVPSTENVRVRADLIDVALRLPPRHAAKLTTHLLTWLRGDEPFHTLIEHRLEPLVGHLVAGNEVKAAEEVLQAAANLLVPITAYGPPVTRMPDCWSYERLLRNNIDALLAADAPRFFDRFVRLLSAALRLGLKREEIKAGHDASAVWREDVASTSESPEDPRDTLVDAVRDAALWIAVTAEGLTRVVAQLEGEPFSIFKRIALHVVRERRALAPDEAARFAMQPALFDAYEVRREYARLLGEVYPELAEDQKAEVLGWVERGPDLSFLHRGNSGGDRTPPRAEVERKYRERWQLEKLALIAQALDGEWAETYRMLVAQYGAPDDPRASTTHEAWVGPTSPFDASELQALGADALVAKLQAWVPPEGWMVASPAGVGRQVAELVAAAPDRFTETEKFTVLEPTYVRSVVDGFCAALTAGRALPWGPALRLVEWILRQPFETEHGDALERDRGWRWARASAARLLSDGLGRKTVPYALRECAWECISKLLEDPDPTSEDEEARSGRGADVANLALNTTRSVALGAAVRYGAWVRTHLGEDAVMSLDPMPELRSALERHLDPERELSRAVRWVYGSRFRYLLSLDAAWARGHVNEIFGTPEDSGALGSTAWAAFVSTSGADRNGYELLRAHYARAVERLGKGVPVVMRLSSPDQLLTHHLARLYWSGVVDVDQSGSPLHRFYEVAPVAVRAHLVAFIGRALRGTTEADLPTGTAERLRALWEARLLSLADVPSAERDAELAAFGWWLAAGNLGAEWLLEHLEAALRLHGRVEPSMFVVERLGVLASAHPAATLRCLELMVQGDVIGWHVESWKRHATQVLQAALANDGAAGSASKLVNELGRRGFQGYRALLPGGTS